MQGFYFEGNHLGYLHLPSRCTTLTFTQNMSLNMLDKPCDIPHNFNKQQKWKNK